MIIESKSNIDQKYLLKTNLKNLIEQKPNGRTLFFTLPKEYVYYRNTEPGDSSWYNRFFLKYMAEPPAIYDSISTKRSADAIRNYLVNKKGYYNATVEVEEKRKKHSTEVKYIVDPKDRYKINSIEYFGDDTEVINTIESINNEALIKKGDYIDATAFDLELTRLSLALQNKGYANFATNYLSIKGDSSLNNSGVDIFMELLPPLPDTFHQKFTVGNINIYTDFHRDQDTSKLDYSFFNTVKYHKQGSNFLVKPKAIDNAIFLKPGTIYNRDSRTKTRKKLSELGTYRFVTMSARLDEVHDSIINYDILLTPFQKKWVADFGWDFFISSISQSSDGNNRVLGLSLSNQMKNRNFLGGAEQFTVSSQVGLELQFNSNNATSFIRSRTFGVNAALQIPRQRNLLEKRPLINILGIINDDTFQQFKENTTTTISAGFTFADLIDNFSRSAVNAAYTHNFKPNSTSRFIIRQLGLEYNDYELSPTFFDQIKDNPLLLRSFDDNLLTGVFFRDITYIYTKPVNAAGNSYTFIANFEWSGIEKYLTNKLYNTISGSNTEWTLNNNIEFAKYFRFEIDPRFYEFFSDKHSFAARAYAGIIIPFGGSDAAPFFKQFSVGGPNSMRGWDQKELGPGAYSDLLLNPIENQTFFQTGDFKLEVNLEYRFDIVYVLEGGLFLDAGNVWTLKDNTDRPGAKLSSTFLDEIAVSAGYGFRFDFTYFNIRFDFGYKLRNPFPFGETTRYWYNWDEIKEQKFGNFQVAVNYPF
ncbi:MAG: BamA/TamA family outer membrane protein [Saprospiraceae bacterium]|nr:BamA/TamA family outer membrane protein [Saprospiraceae bacterium]